MSWSNPKITNPATKFIEFKGDTGEFSYYDKEKEEKVHLPMPIYFVVLDELSTITGYNQRVGSGLFSNEVRSTKDDILNVRSFKGGIQIIGKYQDIKDRITANMGKFCKSVYAMMITGPDKYELVNFKFHGASFGGVEKGRSGWMQKKVNTEKFGVVVKECEQGQVGAIKFMAPVFDAVNLNQNAIDAASEMDKRLQKYLTGYFSQQIEKDVMELEPIEPETTNEEIPDKVSQEEQPNDLPF
jgi:hypothetical protein